ncbi:hypothetical protein A7D27_13500 [Pseudomonas sp. 1D4]|uniref:thermostable hemolysin n=1 Tax=Metapseudomonas otitidis TaxID=319939 RepID=UPI00084A6628|nr:MULTISPECIES: thermostable hemolysin [Pseudomonas]OEC41501.1 hypothetical protein A7D27_13500 [Pseudomonas sp. 1D4]
MTELEWNALFPLHFGLGERRYSLTLHQADDPARAELEAFVHDRFEQAHDADVHHFLPELLALRDATGQLTAVAGMRVAASGPLFLERYLDASLEQSVAQAVGRPIDRVELVEVGNLSSLNAGNARLIIIAVTWLLAARDLRWVSFTGAAGLINSFRRLGLEPVQLAEADPERLGGDGANWGSYYALQPRRRPRPTHRGDDHGAPGRQRPPAQQAGRRPGSDPAPAPGAAAGGLNRLRQSAAAG